MRLIEFNEVDKEGYRIPRAHREEVGCSECGSMKDLALCGTYKEVADPICDTCRKRWNYKPCERCGINHIKGVCPQVGAMALKESNGSELLYHVTPTINITQIKKHGIRLLQTTNWVQSGNKKRFGGGEIYAMTDKMDAIRWAMKMEWDLFHQTANGKISIVVFENTNPENWQIDTNDPISQHGNKGKWLKSHHGVKSQQIRDIISVGANELKQFMDSENTKYGRK